MKYKIIVFLLNSENESNVVINVSLMQCNYDELISGNDGALLHIQFQ